MIRIQVSFTMAQLLFAIVLINVMVAQVQAAPPKWIDLSYPFAENETIYWPLPKNDPFNLELGMQETLPNSTVFIRYYRFSAGEHGGTHMDAPNHFIKDGISVDKIKIEDVVGEGIVVNISAKAEKDQNAELEVSDLEEWEKKHGRIPDNPVVFMYSGWGRFWSDPVKYLGTSTPMNFTTFKFPGLHPDAAKWLIKNRKIKLFGLDTPSLDRGQSRKGIPTHNILLGAGVPGIENVAHLDRLPPKGFEVFAAPMKIKGGSGGPTRVFARIADKMEANAATHAHMAPAFAVMVMALIVWLVKQ